jgi:two-component system NtrC family sensor kinase
VLGLTLPSDTIASEEELGLFLELCSDISFALATIEKEEERQRVEKELRESQARLANAQHIAHIGSWELDIVSNKIIWSDEAYRIFNVRPQKFEATYEAFLSNIHPDDREMVNREYKESVKAKTPYNIVHRLLLKDGSIRYVNERCETYYNKKGQPVRSIGTVQDITERRQIEDALKASEKKLRQMFESITDSIAVMDMDLKIIQMNKAAIRMHGYKNKKELLGRNAFDLIAEKERTQVSGHMQRMMKDGFIKNLEYTLLTKDGREFPAELSAAIIKDSFGNNEGFISISKDITERKTMEEQLLLADRLASVGELASGIAHELNNPLTGIIGLSQMLVQRDLPGDIREDINLVYGEANRAATVVKNLLTFARKHPPAKDLTNVNDIISKVLELRAYEQKINNIHVALDLAPDLPQIMADYFQLQQVFLNIIINAEHFIVQEHRKGNLSIKTRNKGNMVVISFTDNGPGISKENIGNIFNPFFTTKEVGKGTGLGLSICHGIINSHDGRIYAKSESGNGATFVVELPVKHEA